MSDHEHFMRLALEQAKKALAAGEFPVGCLLASNGEVVATGKRTHSRDAEANELDHAEITALRELFAKKPEIDRSTITCYSTMEPCLMCYATLLLNGVRHIVYGYEDAMGGGISVDLTTLTPLYQNMQVSISPSVLREESLALFKDFFANPQNDYWQDSYLARYTLQQE
jgi:tRNA(adenine34) deaminase